MASSALGADKTAAASDLRPACLAGQAGGNRAVWCQRAPISQCQPAVPPDFFSALVVGVYDL
jgi:hypothetical protein